MRTMLFFEKYPVVQKVEVRLTHFSKGEEPKDEGEDNHVVNVVVQRKAKKLKRRHQMKNCVVVLALIAFGTLTVRPWADAQDKATPKEEAKMLKAVAHVNFADSERQKHGLRNVENILKEVQAGHSR